METQPESDSVKASRDEIGEFYQIIHTWIFKNGGKRPAIVTRVRTTETT